MRFVAGLLLMTVCAFGQSAPPFSQLPPVGLAVTETLQVNVYNAAPIPANGGLAPRCDGTVAFYVGGSLVKVAGYLVQFQTTDSVALPYASTGASGARTVVLALITPSVVTPATPGGQIPSCALVSSLETFDTVSGVTHALVSGVAGAARPQRP